MIVVRRDPTNGFQLFVNGTLRSTATFAVTGAFTTATTTATFSEGAADEYNPRFALAEFGFFKRSLTDLEIALLGTQITVDIGIGENVMTVSTTTRLGIYRWDSASDSFTRLHLDTSHAIRVKSSWVFIGNSCSAAAAYEGFHFG